MLTWVRLGFAVCKLTRLKSIFFLQNLLLGLPAIIVCKNIWELQMFTWVWLACAVRKLTKPKSTFHPQDFLLGLRVIIIRKN